MSARTVPSLVTVGVAEDDAGEETRMIRSGRARFTSAVKPSWPSCGTGITIGISLLIGIISGMGISTVLQPSCGKELRLQAGEVEAILTPRPNHTSLTASKPTDSIGFNSTAFKKYLSSFKAVDASFQPWCKQKMKGVDRRTKSGSQFEQDMFLFFNFFLGKAIRGELGFYIDSGANHWRFLSNTLFFDKCLGWKGICLEPNPQYAPGLKQNRSCTFFPECISNKNEFQSFTMAKELGHVGGGSKVHCRTLREFLAAAGATSTIVDFWSLDVEGFEMTVLQSGLPFHQIRMILMENFWLSTRNSDYFLNQAGYVKFAQMAIDGLFLRREHDTWYPPLWAANWKANQEFRKGVKNRLDPNQ